MTGLLLTQSTTPIIGQVAQLLGVVMNTIYTLLSKIGIENIGLCIIIFTIVIYTFMLPLTIKQQKFSKLSAVMNPEIQAVQKKYKGKRDQASMAKQQEEVQRIQEKYGASPMGGCSQLLIQMPILFGLYAVIRNIPAYVDGIKNAYQPLIDGITSTDGFQKIMETIGAAKPILINPDKFDYKKTETLIDVLYKFQEGTWNTLSDKFPALETLITKTESSVDHLNSFLGINIAETPMTLFTSSMKDFSVSSILPMILAISIPVLSGLTQYLNIKLTTSRQTNTGDNDNAMMNSMNTVNKTMPILSVFMCFTFPSGLGLYWIASAIVRGIQQMVINRYLDKIPLEDLIAKNQEKAAKRREKRGTSASKLNEMAQRNVRNIQETKNTKLSDKEIEEKLSDAAAKNENAKAGSLAQRAALAKKYKENKE